MTAWKDASRYLVALAMLSIGLYGLWLGGLWTWLGTASFVGLAIADFIAAPDHQRHDRAPRLLYDIVLYLPLPMMIALWLLLAWHVGHGALGPLELTGAILSVAFLGALAGLPAAHELMHRKHPFEIACASAYLTLFGLPFNDLTHVHIHHPHVGTAHDCDTPRRGESVYRFVVRSLPEGFGEALRLERARLAKLDRPWWWWRGRITPGFAMLAAWVGTFLWLAGWWGVPLLAVTWGVCFLILGGFNYTQHYGLVRRPGVPLAPRHTWNHLRTFSRSVSFEISNHAEHHLDPDKHYQYLQPDPAAPQMPSIVACFLASFVPPLWHRAIAWPRLRHWDNHHATVEERALAAAANSRAGWPANWT